MCSGFAVKEINVGPFIHMSCNISSVSLVSDKSLTDCNTINFTQRNEVISVNDKGKLLSSQLTEEAPYISYHNHFNEKGFVILDKNLGIINFYNEKLEKAGSLKCFPGPGEEVTAIGAIGRHIVFSHTGKQYVASCFIFKSKQELLNTSSSSSSTYSDGTPV
jgi:hypothetical protein